METIKTSRIMKCIATVVLTAFFTTSVLHDFTYAALSTRPLGTFETYKKQLGVEDQQFSLLGTNETNAINASARMSFEKMRTTYQTQADAMQKRSAERVAAIKKLSLSKITDIKNNATRQRDDITQRYNARCDQYKQTYAEQRQALANRYDSKIKDVDRYIERYKKQIADLRNIRDIDAAAQATFDTATQPAKQAGNQMGDVTGVNDKSDTFQAKAQKAKQKEYYIQVAQNRLNYYLNLKSQLQQAKADALAKAEERFQLGLERLKQTYDSQMQYIDDSEESAIASTKEDAKFKIGMYEQQVQRDLDSLWDSTNGRISNLLTGGSGGNEGLYTSAMRQAERSAFRSIDASSVDVRGKKFSYMEGDSEGGYIGDIQKYEDATTDFGGGYQGNVLLDRAEGILRSGADDAVSRANSAITAASMTSKDVEMFLPSSLSGMQFQDAPVEAGLNTGEEVAGLESSGDSQFAQRTAGESDAVAGESQDMMNGQDTFADAAEETITTNTAQTIKKINTTARGQAEEAQQLSNIEMQALADFLMKLDYALEMAWPTEKAAYEREADAMQTATEFIAAAKADLWMAFLIGIPLILLFGALAVRGVWNIRVGCHFVAMGWAVGAAFGGTTLMLYGLWFIIQGTLEFLIGMAAVAYIIYNLIRLCDENEKYEYAYQKAAENVQTLEDALLRPGSGGAPSLYWQLKKEQEKFDVYGAAVRRWFIQQFGNADTRSVRAEIAEIKKLNEKQKKGGLSDIELQRLQSLLYKFAKKLNWKGTEQDMVNSNNILVKSVLGMHASLARMQKIITAMKSTGLSGEQLDIELNVVEGGKYVKKSLRSLGYKTVYDMYQGLTFWGRVTEILNGWRLANPPRFRSDFLDHSIGSAGIGKFFDNINAKIVSGCESIGIVSNDKNNRRSNIIKAIVTAPVKIVKTVALTPSQMGSMVWQTGYDFGSKNFMDALQDMLFGFLQFPVGILENVTGVRQGTIISNVKKHGFFGGVNRTYGENKGEGHVVRDEDGNIVTDENGNPVYRDDAMGEGGWTGEYWDPGAAIGTMAGFGTGLGGILKLFAKPFKFVGKILKAGVKAVTKGIAVTARVVAGVYKFFAAMGRTVGVIANIGAKIVGVLAGIVVAAAGLALTAVYTAVKMVTAAAKFLVPRGLRTAGSSLASTVKNSGFLKAVKNVFRKAGNRFFGTTARTVRTVAVTAVAVTGILALTIGPIGSFFDSLLNNKNFVMGVTAAALAGVLIYKGVKSYKAYKGLKAEMLQASSQMKTGGKASRTTATSTRGGEIYSDLVEAGKVTAGALAPMRLMVAGAFIRNLFNGSREAMQAFFSRKATIGGKPVTVSRVGMVARQVFLAGAGIQMGGKSAGEYNAAKALTFWTTGVSGLKTGWSKVWGVAKAIVTYPVRAIVRGMQAISALQGMALKGMMWYMPLTGQGAVPLALKAASITYHYLLQRPAQLLDQRGQREKMLLERFGQKLLEAKARGIKGSISINGTQDALLLRELIGTFGIKVGGSLYNTERFMQGLMLGSVDLSRSSMKVKGVTISLGENQITPGAEGTQVPNATVVRNTLLGMHFAAASSVQLKIYQEMAERAMERAASTDQQALLFQTQRALKRFNILRAGQEIAVQKKLGAKLSASEERQRIQLELKGSSKTGGEAEGGAKPSGGETGGGQGGGSPPAATPAAGGSGTGAAAKTEPSESEKSKAAEKEYETQRGTIIREIRLLGELIAKCQLGITAAKGLKGREAKAERKALEKRLTILIAEKSVRESIQTQCDSIVVRPDAAGIAATLSLIAEEDWNRGSVGALESKMGILSGVLPGTGEMRFHDLESIVLEIQGSTAKKKQQRKLLTKEQIEQYAEARYKARLDAQINGTEFNEAKFIKTIGKELYQQVRQFERTMGVDLAYEHASALERGVSPGTMTYEMLKTVRGNITKAYVERFTAAEFADIAQIVQKKLAAQAVRKEAYDMLTDEAKEAVNKGGATREGLRTKAKNQQEQKAIDKYFDAQQEVEKATKKVAITRGTQAAEMARKEAYDALDANIKTALGEGKTRDELKKGKSRAVKKAIDKYFDAQEREDAIRKKNIVLDLADNTTFAIMAELVEARTGAGAVGYYEARIQQLQQRMRHAVVSEDERAQQSRMKRFFGSINELFGLGNETTGELRKELREAENQLMFYSGCAAIAALPANDFLDETLHKETRELLESMSENKTKTQDAIDRLRDMLKVIKGKHVGHKQLDKAKALLGVEGTVTVEQLKEGLQTQLTEYLARRQNILRAERAVQTELAGVRPELVVELAAIKGRIKIMAQTGYIDGSLVQVLAEKAKGIQDVIRTEYVQHLNTNGMEAAIQEIQGAARDAVHVPVDLIQRVMKDELLLTELEAYTQKAAGAEKDALRERLRKAGIKGTALETLQQETITKKLREGHDQMRLEMGEKAYLQLQNKLLAQCLAELKKETRRMGKGGFEFEIQVRSADGTLRDLTTSVSGIKGDVTRATKKQPLDSQIAELHSAQAALQQAREGLQQGQLQQERFVLEQMKRVNTLLIAAEKKQSAYIAHIASQAQKEIRAWDKQYSLKKIAKVDDLTPRLTTLDGLKQSVAATVSELEGKKDAITSGEKAKLAAAYRRQAALTALEARLMIVQAARELKAAMQAQAADIGAQVVQADIVAKILDIKNASSAIMTGAELLATPEGRDALMKGADAYQAKVIADARTALKTITDRIAVLQGQATRSDAESLELDGLTAKKTKYEALQKTRGDGALALFLVRGEIDTLTQRIIEQKQRVQKAEGAQRNADAKLKAAAKGAETQTAQRARDACVKDLDNARAEQSTLEKEQRAKEQQINNIVAIDRLSGLKTVIHTNDFAIAVSTYRRGMQRIAHAQQRLEDLQMTYSSVRPAMRESFTTLRDKLETAAAAAAPSERAMYTKILREAYQRELAIQYELARVAREITTQARTMYTGLDKDARAAEKKARKQLHLTEAAQVAEIVFERTGEKLEGQTLVTKAAAWIRDVGTPSTVAAKQKLQKLNSDMKSFRKDIKRLSKDRTTNEATIQALEKQRIEAEAQRNTLQNEIAGTNTLIQQGARVRRFLTKYKDSYTAGYDAFAKAQTATSGSVSVLRDRYRETLKATKERYMTERNALVDTITAYKTRATQEGITPGQRSVAVMMAGIAYSQIQKLEKDLQAIEKQERAFIRREMNIATKELRTYKTRMERILDIRTMEHVQGIVKGPHGENLEGEALIEMAQQKLQAKEATALPETRAKNMQEIRKQEAELQKKQEKYKRAEKVYQDALAKEQRLEQEVQVLEGLASKADTLGKKRAELSKAQKRSTAIQKSKDKIKTEMDAIQTALTELQNKRRGFELQKKNYATIERFVAQQGSRYTSGLYAMQKEELMARERISHEATERRTSLNETVTQRATQNASLKQEITTLAKQTTSSMYRAEIIKAWYEYRKQLSLDKITQLEAALKTAERAARAAQIEADGSTGAEQKAHLELKKTHETTIKTTQREIAKLKTGTLLIDEMIAVTTKTVASLFSSGHERKAVAALKKMEKATEQWIRARVELGAPVGFAPKALVTAQGETISIGYMARVARRLGATEEEMKVFEERSIKAVTVLAKSRALRNELVTGLTDIKAEQQQRRQAIEEIGSILMPAQQEVAGNLKGVTAQEMLDNLQLAKERRKRITEQQEQLEKEHKERLDEVAKEGDIAAAKERWLKRRPKEERRERDYLDAMQQYEAVRGREMARAYQSELEERAKTATGDAKKSIEAALAQAQGDYTALRKYDGTVADARKAAQKALKGYVKYNQGVTETMKELVSVQIKEGVSQEVQKTVDTAVARLQVLSVTVRESINTLARLRKEHKTLRIRPSTRYELAFETQALPDKRDASQQMKEDMVQLVDGMTDAQLKALEHAGISKKELIERLQKGSIDIQQGDTAAMDSAIEYIGQTLLKGKPLDAGIVNKLKAGTAEFESACTALGVSADVRRVLVELRFEKQKVEGLKQYQQEGDRIRSLIDMSKVGRDRLMTQEGKTLDERAAALKKEIGELDKITGRSTEQGKELDTKQAELGKVIRLKTMLTATIAGGLAGLDAAGKMPEGDARRAEVKRLCDEAATLMQQVKEYTTTYGELSETYTKCVDMYFARLLSAGRSELNSRDVLAEAPAFKETLGTVSDYLFRKASAMSAKYLDSLQAAMSVPFQRFRTFLIEQQLKADGVSDLFAVSNDQVYAAQRAIDAATTADIMHIAENGGGVSGLVHALFGKKSVLELTPSEQQAYRTIGLIASLWDKTDVSVKAKGEFMKSELLPNQLLMMAVNDGGAIAALGMGGGKTQVYPTVFGSLVMRNPSKGTIGELLVSSAAEVQNAMGNEAYLKTFYDVILLDGVTLKKQGRLAQRLRKAYENKQNVFVVFDLETRGHLAHEWRTDPKLEVLKKIDVLAIDEADVFALKQQSFITAETLPAPAYVKMQVAAIIEAYQSAVRELGQTYTVNEAEGGITVKTPVAKYLRKRLSKLDCFGGMNKSEIYGAVEQVLRALHEVEKGRVKGGDKADPVGGINVNVRDGVALNSVAAQMLDAFVTRGGRVESFTVRSFENRVGSVSGFNATVSKTLADASTFQIIMNHSMIFGGSGTMKSAADISAAVCAPVALIAEATLGEYPFKVKLLDKGKGVTEAGEFDAYGKDMLKKLKTAKAGEDMGGLIVRDHSVLQSSILSLLSGLGLTPDARAKLERAIGGTEQTQQRVSVAEQSKALGAAHIDAVFRRGGRDGSYYSLEELLAKKVVIYKDGVFIETATGKQVHVSLMDVLKSDTARTHVGLTGAASKPLIETIGRIEVFDNYTNPDLVSGIAKKTAEQHKLVVGTLIVGRGMDFQKHMAEQTGEATDYSWNELLQLVARVGRAGNRNLSFSREVLIDPAKLQTHFEQALPILEYQKECMEKDLKTLKKHAERNKKNIDTLNLRLETLTLRIENQKAYLEALKGRDKADIDSSTLSEMVRENATIVGDWRTNGALQYQLGVGLRKTLLEIPLERMIDRARGRDRAVLTQYMNEVLRYNSGGTGDIIQREGGKDKWKSAHDEFFDMMKKQLDGTLQTYEMLHDGSSVSMGVGRTVVGIGTALKIKKAEQLERRLRGPSSRILDPRLRGELTAWVREVKSAQKYLATLKKQPWEQVCAEAWESYTRARERKLSYSELNSAETPFVVRNAMDTSLFLARNLLPTHRHTAKSEMLEVKSVQIASRLITGSNGRRAVTMEGKDASAMAYTVSKLHSVRGNIGAFCFTPEQWSIIKKSPGAFRMIMEKTQVRWSGEKAPFVIVSTPEEIRLGTYHVIATRRNAVAVSALHAKESVLREQLQSSVAVAAPDDLQEQLTATEKALEETKTAEAALKKDIEELEKDSKRIIAGIGAVGEMQKYAAAGLERIRALEQKKAEAEKIFRQKQRDELTQRELTRAAELARMQALEEKKTKTSAVFTPALQEELTTLRRAQAENALRIQELQQEKVEAGAAFTEEQQQELEQLERTQADNAPEVQALEQKKAEALAAFTIPERTELKQLQNTFKKTKALEAAKDTAAKAFTQEHQRELTSLQDMRDKEQWQAIANTKDVTEALQGFARIDILKKKTDRTEDETTELARLEMQRRTFVERMDQYVGTHPPAAAEQLVSSMQELENESVLVDTTRAAKKSQQETAQADTKKKEEERDAEKKKLFEATRKSIQDTIDARLIAAPGTPLVVEVPEAVIAVMDDTEKVAFVRGIRTFITDHHAGKQVTITAQKKPIVYDEEVTGATELFDVRDVDADAMRETVVTKYRYVDYTMQAALRKTTGQILDADTAAGVTARDFVAACNAMVKNPKLVIEVGGESALPAGLTRDIQKVLQEALEGKKVDEAELIRANKALLRALYTNELRKPQVTVLYTTDDDVADSYEAVLQSERAAVATSNPVKERSIRRPTDADFDLRSVEGLQQKIDEMKKLKEEEAKEEKEKKEGKQKDEDQMAAMLRTIMRPQKKAKLTEEITQDIEQAMIRTLQAHRDRRTVVFTLPAMDDEGITAAKKAMQQATTAYTAQYGFRDTLGGPSIVLVDAQRNPIDIARVDRDRYMSREQVVAGAKTEKIDELKFVGDLAKKKAYMHPLLEGLEEGKTYILDIDGFKGTDEIQAFYTIVTGYLETKGLKKGTQLVLKKRGRYFAATDAAMRSELQEFDTMWQQGHTTGTTDFARKRMFMRYIPTSTEPVIDTFAKEVFDAVTPLDAKDVDALYGTADIVRPLKEAIIHRRTGVDPSTLASALATVPWEPCSIEFKKTEKDAQGKEKEVTKVITIEPKVEAQRIVIQITKENAGAFAKDPQAFLKGLRQIELSYRRTGKRIDIVFEKDCEQGIEGDDAKKQEGVATVSKTVRAFIAEQGMRCTASRMARVAPPLMVYARNAQGNVLDSVDEGSLWVRECVAHGIPKDGPVIVIPDTVAYHPQQFVTWFQTLLREKKTISRGHIVLSFTHDMTAYPERCALFLAAVNDALQQRAIAEDMTIVDRAGRVLASNHKDIVDVAQSTSKKVHILAEPQGVSIVQRPVPAETALAPAVPVAEKRPVVTPAPMPSVAVPAPVMAETGAPAAEAPPEVEHAPSEAPVVSPEGVEVIMPSAPPAETPAAEVASPEDVHLEELRTSMPALSEGASPTEAHITSVYTQHYSEAQLTSIVAAVIDQLEGKGEAEAITIIDNVYASFLHNGIIDDNDRPIRPEYAQSVKVLHALYKAYMKDDTAQIAEEKDKAKRQPTSKGLADIKRDARKALSWFKRFCIGIGEHGFDTFSGVPIIGWIMRGLGIWYNARRVLTVLNALKGDTADTETRNEIQLLQHARRMGMVLTIAAVLATLISIAAVLSIFGAFPVLIAALGLGGVISVGLFAEIPVVWLATCIAAGSALSLYAFGRALNARVITVEEDHWNASKGKIPQQRAYSKPMNNWTLGGMIVIGAILSACIQVLALGLLVPLFAAVVPAVWAGFFVIAIVVFIHAIMVMIATFVVARATAFKEEGGLDKLRTVEPESMSVPVQAPPPSVAERKAVYTPVAFAPAALSREQQAAVEEEQRTLFMGKSIQYSADQVRDLVADTVQYVQTEHDTAKQRDCLDTVFAYLVQLGFIDERGQSRWVEYNQYIDTLNLLYAQYHIGIPGQPSERITDLEHIRKSMMQELQHKQTSSWGKFTMKFTAWIGRFTSSSAWGDIMSCLLLGWVRRGCSIWYNAHQQLKILTAQQNPDEDTRNEMKLLVQAKGLGASLAWIAFVTTLFGILSLVAVFVELFLPLSIVLIVTMAFLGLATTLYAFGVAINDRIVALEKEQQKQKLEGVAKEHPISRPIANNTLWWMLAIGAIVCAALYLPILFYLVPWLATVLAAEIWIFPIAIVALFAVRKIVAWCVKKIVTRLTQWKEPEAKKEKETKAEAKAKAEMPVSSKAAWVIHINGTRVTDGMRTQLESLSKGVEHVTVIISPEFAQDGQEMIELIKLLNAQFDSTTVKTHIVVEQKGKKKPVLLWEEPLYKDGVVVGEVKGTQGLMDTLGVIAKAGEARLKAIETQKQHIRDAEKEKERLATDESADFAPMDAQEGAARKEIERLRAASEYLKYSLLFEVQGTDELSPVVFKLLKRLIKEGTLGYVTITHKGAVVATNEKSVMDFIEAASAVSEKRVSYKTLPAPVKGAQRERVTHATKLPFASQLATTNVPLGFMLPIAVGDKVISTFSPAAQAYMARSQYIDFIEQIAEEVKLDEQKRGTAPEHVIEGLTSLVAVYVHAGLPLVLQPFTKTSSGQQFDDAFISRVNDLQAAA